MRGQCGDGRAITRKSGDWRAKIKLHTSVAFVGDAVLNGLSTSQDLCFIAP
jgi:hypothetical protein